MKQAKHQDRKSWRKWAMTGQRIETKTKELIEEELEDRRLQAILDGRNIENIGQTYGRVQFYAQMASTQFRMSRKSILSRNSNRFNRFGETANGILRPNRNNIRESLRSLDGYRMYQMTGTGAVRRMN